MSQCGFFPNDSIQLRLKVGLFSVWDYAVGRRKPIYFKAFNAFLSAKGLYDHNFSVLYQHRSLMGIKKLINCQNQLGNECHKGNVKVGKREVFSSFTFFFTHKFIYLSHFIIRCLFKCIFMSFICVILLIFVIKCSIGKSY